MKRAFSPSRDRECTGEETDKSWFSDSELSSTDSGRHQNRKSCNKRSGINAKPCSKVKVELTYPHFSLGQLSGFMGAPISFHNLTYEQFVAGELCTIMNCSSATEHRGRVTLLQKISNWHLMINASWNQIQNTHAHIIRKIENKEIGWAADFDRFEKHIFEKVSFKTEKQDKRKTVNQDWFCKVFQKQEGCPKDAPHAAWIGNQMKMVQHFCAACWLKDRSKRAHPECSTDCPLKE